MIRRTHTIAITTLAVLSSVFGCARDSRIDALQRDVAFLRKEIDHLKQQQLLSHSLQRVDEIAILRPGEAQSTTITSDLGVLTVAITNVVEYANGTKVTLKFGNPLSADINGLTVTADYGETDDKGTPVNSTAKKKQMSLDQTFRAAQWTSVPVILEGVPPSKLGFVRLTDLEVNSIALLKSSK